MHVVDFFNEIIDASSYIDYWVYDNLTNFKNAMQSLSNMCQVYGLD